MISPNLSSGSSVSGTMNKWLFGLILALILSGCGSYRPACVDIPLLQNEGDIELDATIASVVEPLGQATVAWAVGNHTAVQGHVNNIGGTYGQLAGGWFKPFGDHKVLELWGGYGQGRWSELYDELNNRYHRHIFFGQADFGWKNLSCNPSGNLKLDLGAALKLGYSNSTVESIQRQYFGDLDRWTEQYDYYPSNSLLVESMIECRIGVEHFKVSASIGWCRLFHPKGLGPRDFAFPFWLGLGLHYSR